VASSRSFPRCDRRIDLNFEPTLFHQASLVASTSVGRPKEGVTHK
jgi:hypothetical protein